jgi:hypothetical protein
VGDEIASQARDEEALAVAPPAEPQPPPIDRLTLQIRAGYGPVFVNRSGPVQHGGRLGAGLILGDHVEVEIALDLLVPLPAENLGEARKEIALVRWPLRFAATGFVTALSLDLGLKVGLVLDFTHVRGVDPALLQADTDRVNPGLALGLVLRYRILDWLAVWAEGGLDVYNTAYDYTRQGATVIRYSALQGRVSGGLAVLFRLL